MYIKRKEFIQIGSLATAAVMLPKFLKAFEQKNAVPPGNKVVVVLQLSGGNDGLNTVIPFSDPVIVGKFVYHCHAVDHEDKGMMGVIEIVPTVKFYDYEAKYAPGGSKHLLPAPLKPNVYQEVRRLAVLAHKALGCRGVSRADFRFDDRMEGTENRLTLTKQEQLRQIDSVGWCYCTERHR